MCIKHFHWSFRPRNGDLLYFYIGTRSRRPNLCICKHTSGQSCVPDWILVQIRRATFVFESSFSYLYIRFAIAFETIFIWLDSQNGILYIWKSAGHRREQWYWNCCWHLSYFECLPAFWELNAIRKWKVLSWFCNRGGKRRKISLRNKRKVGTHQVTLWFHEYFLKKKKLLCRKFFSVKLVGASTWSQDLEQFLHSDKEGVGERFAFNRAS